MGIWLCLAWLRGREDGWMDLIGKAKDEVKDRDVDRERARRGIRLMDGRHCGRCFCFRRSFQLNGHEMEWNGMELKARRSNGYIHMDFFQHGSKQESRNRNVEEKRSCMDLMR